MHIKNVNLCHKKGTFEKLRSICVATTATVDSQLKMCDTHKICDAIGSITNGNSNYAGYLYPFWNKMKMKMKTERTL